MISPCAAVCVGVSISGTKASWMCIVNACMSPKPRLLCDDDDDLPGNVNEQKCRANSALDLVDRAKYTCMMQHLPAACKCCGKSYVIEILGQQRRLSLVSGVIIQHNHDLAHEDRVMTYLAMSMSSWSRSASSAFDLADQTRYTLTGISMSWLGSLLMDLA